MRSRLCFGVGFLPTAARNSVKERNKNLTPHPPYLGKLSCFPFVQRVIAAQYVLYSALWFPRDASPCRWWISRERHPQLLVWLGCDPKFPTRKIFNVPQSHLHSQSVRPPESIPAKRMTISLPKRSPIRLDCCANPLQATLQYLLRSTSRWDFISKVVPQVKHARCSLNIIGHWSVA